jgi:dihydroorotase-like cyclic amidohydrolase
MSDKIEVETTGDFLILDPTTRDVVEAQGFSEVTNSPFIQSRIDSGDLKVKRGKVAEPEPKAK